jgi:adenylosuccinate synthase
MNDPKIVIGSFFGDEGKGATVDSLSSSSSVVIRFNGGPQAGHTVKDKVTGKLHVFSSICSGSFQGSRSYISEYCAVYPPAMVKEIALYGKLIHPIIINPSCPLIIPSDVIESQRHIENLNCGYGFGECIKRHETLDYPLRLFAKDLDNLNILRLKLEAGTNLNKKDIDYYIDACKKIMSNVVVPDLFEMDGFIKFHPFIFEGAQGTLLDREHGFFPYVTRSNTTVKNALNIIKKDEYNESEKIDVHMVMRPYITRHGAGPLPFEYDKPMLLINNENETNVTNKYQGVFRYAPFNFDLLRYSISVNADIIVSNGYNCKIIANVTCMDQIPGLIHCIEDNDHLFLQKKDFLQKISKLVHQVTIVEGI